MCGFFFHSHWRQIRVSKASLNGLPPGFYGRIIFFSIQIRVRVHIDVLKSLRRVWKPCRIYVQGTEETRHEQMTGGQSTLAHKSDLQYYLYLRTTPPRDPVAVINQVYTTRTVLNFDPFENFRRLGDVCACANHRCRPNILRISFTPENISIFLNISYRKRKELGYF